MIRVKNPLPAFPKPADGLKMLLTVYPIMDDVETRLVSRHQSAFA